ncbi:hypothetical protein V6L77_18700 [Pannonibacter sp. Pt2-lr]
MAELHPDWTPDETAWLAAVDKALKGAPRERLVARSEDGFAIEPFMRERPMLPRAPDGWQASPGRSCSALTIRISKRPTGSCWRTWLAVLMASTWF